VKGVSAGRSSTINIFRSHAAFIFPDIDPALFPKSVKRSQDPRISTLLGLTGDPRRDKTPPMLPPILFKDEDTQSMSKLFRNPALFQVCSILSISFLVIFTEFQIGRLIIYGPNALNGDTMKFRSGSTYVQNGQLPKVTFGFIAWIATMVSRTRISLLALIILI